MAKKHIPRASNTHRDDFERLKMELATFFKDARKRLGYKTKDEFADAKNYTRSQYSEYESGTANPTVETIFNLLFEFGLKPEDLFKLPTKSNQNSELTQIIIPNAKLEQLKEQVKISFGVEVLTKFTDQKAIRIIRTLIFCIKPKSKADILSNLGLKNTTNNFKRAIGPALEFRWLKMTNPESPNSPNQMYVISEEGKRMV